MGRNRNHIVGKSPLSKNVIEVSSNLGFSRGDLVYLKNGAIGTVADDAVSTATFPAVTAVPSNDGSPALTTPVSVVPTVRGSAHRSKVAAQLSNGNTVIAYFNPLSSNQVWFTILAADGSTVVAPTAVGSPGNYFKLCVVPLTAGGFVIAWYGNSSYLTYAMYDNNGSATKSATQITDFVLHSTSEWGIVGAARSDGTFWIGFQVTTSNYYYFYTFNAAGVKTSTISGPNRGGYYSSAVGVNNNGYVLTLIFPSGDGSAYWQIYNAANGNVAGSNFTHSGEGKYSICTLSDGNLLLAYTRSNQLYYRLVTGDTTMGNETATGFAMSSDHYGGMEVYALDNGAWIAVGRTVTNAQTGVNQDLGYAVFNSSGTLVASGYLPGACTNYIIAPSFSRSGNVLTVYFATAQAMGSTYVDHGISRFSINLTDYTVTPARTVTTSLGNTSAVAVSGYAKENSSPMAAAFKASNSQTLTVTVPQTSANTNYIVAPTKLESAACWSIHATTLQDGSHVILYQLQTGVVKLTKISAAGATLISPVTLATGTPQCAGTSCRLITLTNGNIAVGYRTAVNALTLKVMTPTFSEVTTITQTTYNGDLARNYDIAALTNARLLLHYTNGGGYQKLTVFNSSTGASLFDSGTFGVLNDDYYLACRGDALGNFVISYYRSSNTTRYRVMYLETSTNNWSGSISESITNNSGYTNAYLPIVLGPCNHLLHIDATNSAQMRIRGGAGYIYTSAYTTVSTQANLSIRAAGCVTGAGVPVFFDIANNRLSMLNGVYSAVTETNIQPAVSTYGQSTTMHTVTMAPSYQYNCLLGYLDTNSHPTFCVVNPVAYTTRATLVAGTTVSNADLALNPGSGYYLLGVAETDCAPGGTGFICTSGGAQLGSQYPTTTAQTFDFQTSVVKGARGSIAGRNVTLVGDQS